MMTRSRRTDAQGRTLPLNRPVRSSRSCPNVAPERQAVVFSSARVIDARLARRTFGEVIRSSESMARTRHLLTARGASTINWSGVAPRLSHHVCSSIHLKMSARVLSSIGRKVDKAGAVDCPGVEHDPLVEGTNVIENGQRLLTRDAWVVLRSGVEERSGRPRGAIATIEPQADGTRTRILRPETRNDSRDDAHGTSYSSTSNWTRRRDRPPSRRDRECGRAAAGDDGTA